MRSSSPHTSQNFLILQEGHDTTPFNIFPDSPGRYYIIYIDYSDCAGKSRSSTSKYAEQSRSANTLPLENNYQPQPPCPKPPALLLVLVKPVAWHGL